MRVAYEAVEQGFIMLNQAFHTPVVEQVAYEVKKSLDTVGRFGDIELQILAHAVETAAEARYRETARGALRLHGVLHHNFYLEQWLTAQIAFRVQFFHEFLERQILVRISIQRYSANVLHELDDCIFVS